MTMNLILGVEMSSVLFSSSFLTIKIETEPIVFSLNFFNFDLVFNWFGLFLFFIFMVFGFPSPPLTWGMDLGLKT